MSGDRNEEGYLRYDEGGALRLCSRPSYGEKLVVRPIADRGERLASVFDREAASRHASRRARR